jgi:osmotically inducible protein OsmC
LFLGEEGFTADSIDTKAVVSLDEVDGGFEVSHVALTVEASIPNISDEVFQKLCESTKNGCPISKLLKAEISLDAKLI